MNVTLRNDAGAEEIVSVDDTNPIDAAKTAKAQQITATGDRSWRALKARS